MSPPLKCSDCGAAIPTDGPGLLCPHCLMNLGLQSPPDLEACFEIDAAHPRDPLAPTPQNSPPPTYGAAENPGDNIGRYRLVREIGRGGYGIVYLAEQDQPIRRQVALKVIKPGMDTDQVVARFAVERQALALMDHPGIAKVWDGGATESGRPYFVMELVEGTPITQYCDHEALSIDHRLTFFVQVCKAIQHAHQKGVIHRDIKPTNILVANCDGTPSPKIIDFGIAKAFAGQLTDQTALTAHPQFMGTPAYMSPEQTGTDGADVDTRTDIYSLGVLLYELLVGTPPFNPRPNPSLELELVCRAIRETEAIRPSLRLDGLEPEDAKAIAQHRCVDAHHLIQRVRGDLDWIVLRCLEKDRNRRYETANALAMDVLRHLENEPVAARPPSTTYRFQKFARRNRLLLTASSLVTLAMVLAILELLKARDTISIVVVAVLLVLGVMLTTREALRARRAEREEARSRLAAETARANEAKQRQAAEAAADTATRRAYASDMLAAWQSFHEGAIGRTRALLSRHRPTSDTSLDLRGFEWCYLWDQSRQTELRILHPPTDSLGHTLVFRPDGRELAVGSSNGKVAIWNFADAAWRTVFQAHQEDVAAIDYSPDGRTLATASRFSEHECAKLWDLSGSEPRATPLPMPGPGEVHWIGFSPDGQRLCTVTSRAYSKSDPAEVWIWDVDLGHPLVPLKGHRAAIRQASFSSDGRFIAAGDTQGITKVWDVHTGAERRTLTGHHGYITAVCFIPGSHHLATAGQNGTVMLWDIDSGDLLRVLSPHQAPLFQMAVSPDGRTLATACRDHTSKLLDLVTGDEVATFRGHSDRIWSAAFSPDDHSIATASAGRTVRLWRWANTPTASPFAAKQSPGTMHFSPDGKLLAQEIWNEDQITLWNPSTFTTERPMIPGRDSVFTPDNRRLGVLHQGDIVLHALHDDSEPRVLSPNRPISGPFVAAPRDDIAALRSGNQYLILDLCTGAEITRLEGSNDEYVVLLFVRQGRQLVASGPTPGTLRVWDTPTWTVGVELAGHQASVEALALAPDGLTLASGGRDRSLQFWDTTTWRRHPMPPFHSTTGAITRLAYSPDQKCLAIGTYDGVIKLWNLSAQDEVGVLRAHQSIIRGLTFSPDGRTLLSSSYDGLWKRWDAPLLAAIDGEPS
ncbi:MAG: serine/threonine protein kinase [Verrucomicrobiales bacterium]|nr:serine/threonine protein kinase [Verrucomicrobiales bacterium]